MRVQPPFDTDGRVMTILTQWDGDGFVPLGRHKKQCNADMVVGQVYPLDIVLERSDASHRHFFASVNEAWLNLPEQLAERFKTSEHLRKHCLIKAGLYEETSIVCSSPGEATRVAAFVQPMDDYAIVVVNGYVVSRYTAKSQSKQAMGGVVFQQSKTAVLQILSDMIGVTPGELEKASA